MNKQVFGLGIALTPVDAGLGAQAIAIKPQQQADIREGDIIEEVDGNNVQQAHLLSISKLLSGEENTPVSLTLRRQNDERTHASVVHVVAYRVVAVDSHIAPATAMSSPSASEILQALQALRGREVSVEAAFERQLAATTARADKAEAELTRLRLAARAALESIGEAALMCRSTGSREAEGAILGAGDELWRHLHSSASGGKTPAGHAELGPHRERTMASPANSFARATETQRGPIPSSDSSQLPMMSPFSSLPRVPEGLGSSEAQAYLDALRAWAVTSSTPQHQDLSS